MKKLGGKWAWFAYFRSEHRGAVFIFAIAFCLALVPRIFINQSQAQKYTFHYDTAAVAMLLAQQEDYMDSVFGRHKSAGRTFKYLSKKQLIALGFSADAAERIDKVRKAGREFHSFAELGAETGMDSASLARIVTPASFHSKGKRKDDGKIIELNLADTTELKTLDGIGDKTAQRILNYRTRLGGFYSLEQLMEIWYVDTVKLRSLFPRLTANSNLVSKIQINRATESQLANHPYISKKQASLIFAYIKQHKNIDREQFANLIGMALADKQKLLPYLDFSL